jgi:hypothetical protein
MQMPGAPLAPAQGLLIAAGRGTLVVSRALVGDREAVEFHELVDDEELVVDRKLVEVDEVVLLPD